MLAVALVLNIIIIGGGLLVITLRVSPAYKAECDKLAQAKKKTAAAMAHQRELARQVLLIIVLYLLCSVGCLIFLLSSYYH